MSRDPHDELLDDIQIERDDGAWIASFRVRLECACGYSDFNTESAATLTELSAMMLMRARELRAAPCPNVEAERLDLWEDINPNEDEGAK